LLYDYVESVIERRAPYLDAQLAAVREYVDRGGPVLGRAFANEPDGAAIEFNVDDRAKVQAFTDNARARSVGPSWTGESADWTVAVGTASRARRAAADSAIDASARGTAGGER
jgi:hypothetical protein